jgi:hypothetical protein
MDIKIMSNVNGLNFIRYEINIDRGLRGRTLQLTTLFNAEVKNAQSFASTPAMCAFLWLHGYMNGNKFGEYDLLGCNAVYFGNRLKFRRNISPSCSG